MATPKVHRKVRASVVTTGPNAHAEPGNKATGKLKEAADKVSDKIKRD